MLQKNTLVTDQIGWNEKEHLVKKNISLGYFGEQGISRHAYLYPLQDNPYYPGKAQLALIQKHNDQQEKN